MKIVISFLIVIMLCFTLASCAKEDKTASVVGGVTAPATGDAATEDSDGAWAVATSVECTFHHRDYHLIPYHLVKYIGVDKSNEWAEKAKESAKTDATENECACPDFNIRSYIDHFKVSRDDFLTYGDIIYYATYDLDVLYNKTPEEIFDYYIYSDALIDKTITSQHFQFIETHLKYEYYSEIVAMTIYDDTLGAGIYPSIPTLVQKLGIDRGAFEKILEECTERNESVYGRSFNFDYDLDMIFNADGSYKELPELSTYSEFLRELKLNRLFCGIEK